MNISVIIPTRNHGARLAGPLRLLFDQTLSADQYEIVVVDNGSTDNTLQVLARLSREAKNLRWVREPVPGRAVARNRGIRESRGELVVFLDDDIVVRQDYLESHLRYHSWSTGNIAVIGQVIDVSPIRPMWLEDYLHARQSIGSSGSPQPTHGLHFATGNVSLLRSTLERIRVNGGSSPMYFDPTLITREDGDMGCRLVKAGVQLIFADDIVCYHHHPRNLKGVLKRAYQIGYSTVQLIEKHPEVAVTMKHVTSSPLINTGLLIACMGLFFPTFLLRPVWPEPLHKVVGGLLLYQTNRGYQRALRDRSKVIT